MKKNREVAVYTDLRKEKYEFIHAVMVTNDEYDTRHYGYMPGKTLKHIRKGVGARAKTIEDPAWAARAGTELIEILTHLMTFSMYERKNNQFIEKAYHKYWDIKRQIQEGPKDKHIKICDELYALQEHVPQRFWQTKRRQLKYFYKDSTHKFSEVFLLSFEIRDTYLAYLKEKIIPENTGSRKAFMAQRIIDHVEKIEQPSRAIDMDQYVSEQIDKLRNTDFKAVSEDLKRLPKGGLN